jgi:hypothetical protein
MRAALAVVLILTGCGGGIDTRDEIKPECTLAQVAYDGYVTCTSPKESSK